GSGRLFDFGQRDRDRERTAAAHPFPVRLGVGGDGGIDKGRTTKGSGMDFGTELTRVTLGIDRLYRSQNTGDGVLDREGLVPVILTDLKPTPFENYAQADAALADLQAQLPAVSDALRRAYLAEMLDSLRALLVTFQGRGLSYAERVERCLRVPAAPVEDAILAGYRETIARSLRALGYGGGDLGAELA